MIAPFKQKCRDAGGLCGGYTGSGAGSKVASYQRHFYVNARSCQMWSDHAIWRIASACCNVDASVTMLVGSCRNAVPGVSRRCHRGIGGWFQKNRYPGRSALPQEAIYGTVRSVDFLPG